jgi:hypothetical protein
LLDPPFIRFILQVLQAFGRGDTFSETQQQQHKSTGHKSNQFLKTVAVVTLCLYLLLVMTAVHFQLSFTYEALPPT